MRRMAVVVCLIFVVAAFKLKLSVNLSERLKVTGRFGTLPCVQTALPFNVLFFSFYRARSQSKHHQTMFGLGDSRSFMYNLFEPHKLTAFITFGFLLIGNYGNWK